MYFKRDILDAIRRIHRALRESSRAAEQQIGLSGAQLLVLQQLRANPSQSISELGEKTQTHQSSVSVVVGKLEKAGYVSRRQAEADARRAEISLTTSGARLLKQDAPTLAQEKLFAAIEKLSTTKQTQLAKLLIEVVELADLSEQPPTLFFED